MSYAWKNSAGAGCQESGRPRRQSGQIVLSTGIAPSGNLPMRSLRTRLIALWAMLGASALVTGFLLLQFYQQSANVQVGQAEGLVIRACRDIGDRYAFFASGWRGSDVDIDDRLKGELTDVVWAALARSP